MFPLLCARHPTSSLLPSPRPLCTLRLPPLSFPPAGTTLLLVSVGLFCLGFLLFLLNPLTFFTQLPPPPESCQSVLCIWESESVLSVSFSCSLDSTCECDALVLVCL